MTSVTVIIYLSIQKKILYSNLALIETLVGLNDSQETDQLRFLGLIIYSRLCWTAHVEYVAMKIARGLFLLRRLKSTVDASILIKVDYDDIPSLLSNGIILRGHSNCSNKLFLLQKSN